MTLAHINPTTTSIAVDQEAILRHLKLNPNDPKTQALLLVCNRYGLDPVLRHMVLVDGNPYVTRDGYLHVAHSSGQFDGIEVTDTGKDDSHWWAKVSVYRKDMGRPFSYIGRYPLAGSNKKYGPEMAIKTAEVASLRRAFDVAGVPALDEQWDAVEAHEAALNAPELASAEQIARIQELGAVIRDDHLARGEARRFCGENAIDATKPTAEQADALIAFLEGLVPAEPETASAHDIGRIWSVVATLTEDQKATWENFAGTIRLDMSDEGFTSKDAAEVLDFLAALVNDDDGLPAEPEHDAPADRPMNRIERAEFRAHIGEHLRPPPEIAQSKRGAWANQKILDLAAAVTGRPVATVDQITVSEAAAIVHAARTGEVPDAPA